MKFVLFYHSIQSDWNHGNAHFLRGLAAELIARGHEVHVYEPADAWSVQNLVADHGMKPIEDFRLAFPHLRPDVYDAETLDLDEVLDDADIVIVHEWNDHELVRRVGQHRARHDYRLFFHDTHHRALTQPDAMAAYDLSNYDGVLAYGKVLRDIYLERGWARNAWTWHEAADTRIFHPRPHGTEPEGDVVWVGNWGDDERTAELHEFLIDPVRDLQLKARVYGVRYPPAALQSLADANIDFAGWLPNDRVPEVFSKFRLTVHVPRRPYVTALRGIPTIRPFEAMACAIPLISAPWEDAEHLFTPGEDYLVARDGAEMRRHMGAVLSDKPLAQSLAEHGLQTILARHTCAHRVDELMSIAGVVPSAEERDESGQLVVN